VLPNRRTPDNLREIIRNHANSIEALEKYRGEVIDDIAYYDRAILDFRHLIEFGKFPANVLSKIHKRFSVCLKKRRELKDNLACLDSIEYRIKRFGLKARLEEITLGICIYAPRVLSDMFVEFEQYIPDDVKINVRRSE
jgi:hypothetical protein